MFESSLTTAMSQEVLMVTMQNFFALNLWLFLIFFSCGTLRFAKGFDLPNEYNNCINILVGERPVLRRLSKKAFLC